jgi:carbonic anhydrase
MMVPGNDNALHKKTLHRNEETIMLQTHGEKLSAQEALELLVAGNEQFCHEHFHVEVSTREINVLDTDGQHPFATVITCSDSRVPPELIFNRGLGEIFVIRTAGNVLGDFEIGSAEYAAEHLHTHLIVVMGHSHCGAVASTVAVHGQEGYLGRILHEIEPSVAEAKRLAHAEEEVVPLAEDLNIRHGVEILKNDPILKACPDLMIVGAKYDTHTGKVRFLPGM